MKFNAVTFSIFALAAAVGSTAQAKDVEHKVNGNWRLLEIIDEMDDSSSCILSSLGTDENASIAFYSRGFAAGFAKSFQGSGVTWRIDGGEAVSVGREYKGGDTYLIRGKELDDLVAAFKAGTNVVLRVYPENQFADTKTSKISLVGFTEAYDKTMKCDF